MYIYYIYYIIIVRNNPNILFEYLIIIYGLPFYLYHRRQQPCEGLLFICSVGSFVCLDHYFVPLLRNEDDSNLPRIGAPWTPSEIQNSTLYGPSEPSTPMESPIRVKAYAGPMDSIKV